MAAQQAAFDQLQHTHQLVAMLLEKQFLPVCIQIMLAQNQQKKVAQQQKTVYMQENGQTHAPQPQD